MCFEDDFLPNGRLTIKPLWDSGESLTNKSNVPRSLITLAGCWARAQRKFHEARESGEHYRQSAWIVRQVQLLYEIECRLRKT